jgi:uncharacterized membrane protein YjjB (DUF3815 family)
MEENSMKKNLFLAGFLSMIVPGSHILYIENKWRKAIGEFIVGVIVWVVSVLLSNFFKQPLIILIAPIILFYDGMTAARSYNKKIVST